MVLKTIRPDLVEDVEVRRCFRREIAVTARLRHAHIVRHIAHGRWCGLDVLALEHIRGVNLAEILSCTALPLGSALCVAEDIARALAYLHSLQDERGLPLGFVHGDLSPQNLLIDEIGQAHLIDFGGVLIRGVPACPESIVCKPGYASPEQMRGGAIDGRSDQYALGIVLWEMLVGRELFEGDGARRSRPIPPVSSRVSVPFAVDATVIRMLAYEEGARFANTGEVAEALAAVTWAHGPHESRGWLTARAQEPITLEGDAIVETDEATCPMRRPEPAGWATRRCSGRSGMSLASGVHHVDTRPDHPRDRIRHTCDLRVAPLRHPREAAAAALRAARHLRAPRRRRAHRARRLWQLRPCA